MSYIYKIVSLQEYLNTPNANKPKSYQTPYPREVNLGQVIQSLLNKYAKEGWEFERIEELKPKDFQGTASKAISTFMMGNRKDEDNYLEQNFKYFIFKKPFSEDLHSEIEKTHVSSEEDSKNICDLNDPYVKEIVKETGKYIEILQSNNIKLVQYIIKKDKLLWRFINTQNNEIIYANSIDELKSICSKLKSFKWSI